MTREFFKWVKKYKVTMTDLTKVLSEIEEGNFEADLGGHVQKNALNPVTKAKEEAAG